MSSFIELEETPSPDRFRLPLTPAVCVGPPAERFMLGGVGLAAAIQAMERRCQRSIAWATAQFVSFARAPQIVDLEFTPLRWGQRLTQAMVIARSESQLLFHVSGALVAKGENSSRDWISAPDVRAPDECPEGMHWRADDDGLHGRLEIRVAKGRYGRDRIGAPESDGRLIIWVRPREPAAIDCALLAVIADLLPNGIGNALGLNAGGSSLDNTIRIIRLTQTKWILVEISIQALDSGLGHGGVRIYAEDGRLMALASQSLIVRIRD
jgi:acyl-CoA thioesterase II